MERVADTVTHDEANRRLFEELSAAYLTAFPGTAREQERAERSLIKGGSHTLRLFDPAPLRIRRAVGATVQDVDGNEILDFWQGHYANILGHNPPLLTDALIAGLENGYALQTGIVDTVQTEFAELLLDLTGTERLRFTTSGALADLYAIMLARAFTDRDITLKVGGGWQGAHPLALKGVSFRDGFDHPETEGLSKDTMKRVLLTRYNDPEDLRAIFRRRGDRIACFIVEPWLGMGGFMPADPEYLATARELADRYGAMLIFDEIISGFRFCASGVAKLYGITPDLTTFAKIVGGGMPVAVVAGRADIMALCHPEHPRRVKFDGGTFSAHPASLLAGKTLISWLAEHADEVYPRLGEMGEAMRRGVEQAFAEEGVFVRCTGYGNRVVPGSSVGMVHFPRHQECTLTTPDEVWDPAICDVVRREKILKLALLLERVHVMHGLGTLSTAHTEAHLTWLFEACRGAARRLKEPA